jgi:hypothetical protein
VLLAGLLEDMGGEVALTVANTTNITQDLADHDAKRPDTEESHGKGDCS